MENYVSPFSKLFCIQVNNAPAIGEYFTANSTVPGNEELVKLMNDPSFTGFYGQFFSGSSKSGNLTYNIGDKMKSLVNFDGTKLLKNQFNNNFPFPKPDAFGVCDNFKSAHFMLND